MKHKNSLKFTVVKHNEYAFGKKELDFTDNNPVRGKKNHAVAQIFLAFGRRKEDAGIALHPNGQRK